MRRLASCVFASAHGPVVVEFHDFDSFILGVVNEHKMPRFIDAFDSKFDRAVSVSVFIVTADAFKRR